MPSASYPALRLRRLRQKAGIRDMVQETQISPSDFIWPLFVIDGENIIEPISSMPDVFRYTIDKLVEQAERAISLNIPAIALFPKIDENLKDADGTEASNPNSLICRAVRAVKAATPDLIIMCDVALDPYTDHGHDGILSDGVIANDETITHLTAQALTLAKAGCDIIGPSDMMDGRVGAIRAALDGAGFEDVLIMSYAAKYASAFYGPFRDAVGAGKKLGGDGKKTYQMNPANSDEALREIEMDLAEGADMVMVKPGMPYLDIIRRAKDRYNAPLFAYQVSGEYSMLMAAIDNGWLDRHAAMFESLMSFKRAGCDGILTYLAPEMAEILQKR